MITTKPLVGRIRIEHDEDAEDPRLGFDHPRKEIIDAYLNGEVYGFIVERPTFPTTVTDNGWLYEDSCWGFYGDDIGTNGVLENIQEYLEAGYKVVKEN